MARGRGNDDPDTADDTYDDDTGQYPAQYATPDGASRPATAARHRRPVKRARLGVVLATVLLSELVLIGAGLNQAVAKHLDTFVGRHSGFPGEIARSLLVLRWSFAPQHHHSDLWHAQLITIGLTLLFSLILVGLVVHGPITWLQSFFGTWLAVTVATVAAAVTALVLADLEQSADFTYYVVPGNGSTHLSTSAQFQQAIFGGFLPFDFVAGLALGLVVGLLVALIAVATRRTDPVPVAVVPAQGTAPAPEVPQPFFGDEGGAERRSGYGAARYDTPAYSAPERRADSETVTFPAVSGGYPDAAPDASNETTALPRVGTDRPPESSTDESTQAWPAQPERPAADEGEQTAAFPLPPDDDDLDRDLGHQPDD